MFKEELKLVPHLPGSYQMKNKSGNIIYVGKAKDLHNRLHSYFTGRVTGKTAKMVSEVDHFEYIVTTSELEAFILEINLIKKSKNKKEMFTIIWTIKESYSKLIGLGLNYNYKKIDTFNIKNKISIKKYQNYIVTIIEE